MFNQENLTDLQSTCTKIANVCSEQVDGFLMYSQMICLGELIKDFINNPIVKSSGVIEREKDKLN